MHNSQTSVLATVFLQEKIKLTNDVCIVPTEKENTDKSRPNQLDCPDSFHLGENFKVFF